MAPRSKQIKQVEVLLQKNDGNTLEWAVLWTANEKQKITRVQDLLVIEFQHEAGNVQTTYNLNNFLGYSIVQ